MLTTINNYSQLVIWVLMIVQTAISAGGRTGILTIPPSGNIWHIRLDGGNATRCTGLVNNPDPGSGTGQPCAFNHPYWMLNQTSGAWISFTSGDTMEFDDPPTNTTHYYLGVGLNGLAPPAGSNSFCTGAVTDCVIPAIPSGIHIKGQNTGNCHNAQHTALNFPTIWDGLNGLFWMLDVTNSNNAIVECLAFTQPDTCNRLLNGSLNSLASSSISGGTATYVTFLAGGNNNPLPTQRISVVGSTNNALLNITNKQVNTFSTTTWNITNSSATATVLTLAYTVTSGDVPRVGQTVFQLAGLTNAGGSYNTSFGNGTIASSSGTTSGTMTISGSFTAAASQAETGTGIDFNSGTATVTGIAGSVASAPDSGSMFPTGSCQPGVNNYVQHGLQMELGTNKGPSNFTLRDFAVVGVTAQGILGSDLNTTGADVSNFSDIYIIGNGLAGWDGDGGGCGTSCEDVGTVNFNFADIEWNGCMAVKPYNFNLPASSNTYDLCFAQNTGGYGDCISFIAAGNVTFNVDHSTFKNCTQDGLDSAHLGDDLTHNPTTIITNSWASGNMGQTFKMGAGAVSTAINNFSSGDCRFLTIASNVPSNPAGWNAGIQNTADSCRAGGDQWAISAKNGQTITLENNTSTGQGATMYDIECFPTVTCTNTTSIIFRNLISKGFVDPVSGNIAAGIFIGGSFTADPFSFPGSLITNNIWNTMRNPTCPQDPSEVNCRTVDPLLVAESSVYAIDPHLTSGSPAIHGGIAPAPAFGQNGTAQTTPPTQGAFVF